MNAALVPIKSLAAGKSRLEGALDRQRLAQLCLAMMEDVVAALLAVETLDRVVVATPDVAAADAARQLGAEAFLGEDPGLNFAIDRGSQQLLEAGASSVMTVLGDVAGAEPADFARLIDETNALAATHGGAAVGLAPSSDGGTAALVRCPPRVIDACFGADSATRHRAECKRLSIALCELDLPSLRIDLDREADVEAFLALGRGGPRTRAALESMDWRSVVSTEPSDTATRGAPS